MIDYYTCIKCGKSGMRDLFIFHKCKPKNPMVSDMTLRDWFAGQALMGMMACGEAHNEHTSSVTAAAAYQMADAMLKAREEKP